VTHPLHPVDLPLASQIALDLLAPHLNRAAGLSLVLGGPDRLRATAALWLDPPAGAPREPAGRVLWLVDADGPAPIFPPSPYPLPLEGTPLAQGAVVGVVGPGPLAALRARVRGQPASFPTVAAIERQLRDRGLAVALRWRIGGPATLWWAALSIAAARADRPDLADRMGIFYRRSLAPRSGAGLAEGLALLARARSR
jgi:hypothetical protein